MSELQEEVTGAQEVPTFDPNKKYTWAVDEKFSLSGNEFGLLLNALRAIISTQEAATIILAHKASESLEGVLGRGVESGVVKEVAE
jgi:hypothetical protein